MQQEHCLGAERIVSVRSISLHVYPTNLHSGDLTKEEKLEYIRAVNCIRKQPSKLPAGKYPGAHSRYDDFVVVHMNMTPSVHSTANFMHWHRYYIWCVLIHLYNSCDSPL